MAGLSAIAEYP